MPVLIGLDYGPRRIGIAACDEGGRLASPVMTHREGTDGSVLTCLRDLIAARGVVGVVVGLPLTADGRETDMAARARRFVGVLERELAVPVHLWDERYSSQEAERILARRRRSGPREDVDALAAALILQSWLDAHPEDAEGPA